MLRTPDHHFVAERGVPAGAFRFVAEARRPGAPALTTPSNLDVFVRPRVNAFHVRFDAVRTDMRGGAGCDR